MFKKFLKFISKSFDGGTNSWSSLSGGLNDTPLASNTSRANLMASNKNWVYACVDKIAITMAGVNFRLRKYNKEGDDEIVDDHAVLKVFRKPNGVTLGSELIYTTVSHQELTGNGYWLVDKFPNPTSMQWLLPQQVTAAFNDAKTEIIGFNVQTVRGNLYVEKERIIHFKYPNALSPVIGAGTLEHVAEWVDVDNAATEFNRLFFKQGGSVSGIVKTDATTKEALELARIGWEMRHEGMQNAHKTAFLGKDMDYTQTGTTPRDMEFSELDNRYRDKILSAFGVPKSVLGITEIGTSRADAEAKNYAFLAFTIKPKADILLDYLNEYFLPKFTGTEQYYFDYENFIPENDELILRKNQVGLAGQSYLTINEVRASQGLPPIANGDNVYGSFAVVPIGKPVPAEDTKKLPASAQSKKVIPSRIKEFERKEEKKDELADKVADKLLDVLKNVDFAEVAHKQFITRVTTYENQFISQTKKFDEAFEKMILENLEAEKSFVKNKVNVGNFVNAGEATDLLVGLTIPILLDLMRNEGQAQLDRLNTTEPFNPNNETVQDKIRRSLRLAGESYVGTTFSLLNESLGEGVANGESMAKLTERVRDVFHLTDTYRAERIARSTVFQAANTSAREAYRQSGVVTEVRWHTAEDELTCEYCEPMNGKTVGIEDSFFDEGDTVRGRDGGVLKLDYDDVEDPPLHANCRCFTNAVVVEKATPEMITKEASEEDAETKLLQELVDELDHE
jgi:HK97 family phage portal protein